MDAHKYMVEKQWLDPEEHLRFLSVCHLQIPAPSNSKWQELFQVIALSYGESFLTTPILVS